VNGLKHQKEKRSMEHFAGLDVSVKATSVCIVDDTGSIVREVKVASEPDALLAVLKSPTYHFQRIGLEAGPLSQWLFSALAEAGLPAICDAAHARRSQGSWLKAWAMTAPSSAGAGKRPRPHDNARSNLTGETRVPPRGGMMSLTARWMR
jgi:hypothetical protein